MTTAFNKYYNAFLGINMNELKGGKRIFCSAQRDLPVNRNYFYPVIAVQIEGRIIFSVSPEFYNEFSLHISDSVISNLKDAKIILSEFFKRKSDIFSVREMFRFSKENYKQYKAFKKNQAAIIPQPEFNEVKFSVSMDKMIISYAKISDIDFSAGNIVVFTQENFRKRGYGKKLVSKCVEWCFSHEILPVYFCEAENTASIKLSKSLDFEIKSEESMVTKNNSTDSKS